MNAASEKRKDRCPDSRDGPVATRLARKKTRRANGSERLKSAKRMVPRRMLVMTADAEETDLICRVAIKHGCDSHAVKDIEAFKNAFAGFRPTVIVIEIDTPLPDGPELLGLEFLGYVAERGYKGRIVLKCRRRANRRSLERSATGLGLPPPVILDEPVFPTTVLGILRVTA